eukprot:m.210687 g.210687  ORF g.210687 m.210687 type:complete len:112 (+) comp18566_c0_seq3:5141-5476(+)
MRSCRVFCFWTLHSTSATFIDVSPAPFFTVPTTPTKKRGGGLTVSEGATPRLSGGSASSAGSTSPLSRPTSPAVLQQPPRQDVVAVPFLAEELEKLSNLAATTGQGDSQDN